MSEHIRLEIKNSVANIIFNKAPLNIMTIEDLQLLSSLVKPLNKDKNIKLVVFKSESEVFSAGLDIKEHYKKFIPDILELLVSITSDILEIKYPTISLVNGLCLGGGFEIALLSDLVLASEKAEFGFPEVKLAHMAPIAITILPEMIGIKKTNQLILTGKTFSAHEALHLHLINKLYKIEEFESASQSFIDNLLEYSQAALLANVKVLRKNLLNKLDYMQEDVNNVYLNELINHKDSEEGINAFIEKRKPVWEL